MSCHSLEMAWKIGTSKSKSVNRKTVPNWLFHILFVCTCGGGVGGMYYYWKWVLMLLSHFIWMRIVSIFNIFLRCAQAFVDWRHVISIIYANESIYEFHENAQPRVEGANKKPLETNESLHCETSTSTKRSPLYQSIHSVVVFCERRSETMEHR